MEAATATPTPPDGAAAPSGDLADTAVRLRLSATRLARILRQQADIGLTPTQIAALATLHRCGPIPVGTLADEEQVSAPTATKTVERLHAAGLVSRVGDPTDRRVTLVSITAEGDALLADIRARKTAWLSTRLGELPAEELARLTDALDVLEHLTTPQKDPS
ncbi:MarR family transcriptional regulator [Aquihabitans sp. G128]|uniref:MarR family winged helix-turn-helix transcriptional regulator n=1 Tax=Aquihabitans sp. G128 TaxID=2849779 RepID=UPI001C2409D7|nr:MarR family transcriptional regulator [Aquihabitans sp. G128]QXC61496.1 MarR family transcriptional regulator [Aquihabitans sp. G128]